MRLAGRQQRTIWSAGVGNGIGIIDQTRLPHEIETVELRTLEEAAVAIERMQVRGAPLIGATAAYAVYLAVRVDPSDEGIDAACDRLIRTRPTAVDLRHALERMRAALLNHRHEDRLERAHAEAERVADDAVAICSAIGDHGLALIREAAARRPDSPVNILTHCNAGWLACVDWGTATAPIYKAHEAGIPLHVWVDETRPRNQGAALTALELREEGVPHTVIADNVGGHIMQHGRVDLCIVGTDRTTRTGDVANKIGTYLKALAAKDNGVPFYIALPSTTIDWRISDGVAEIPIEERDPREVTHITGRAGDGRVETVQLTPDRSPAANYGFDVTPARLVSGLITERGVCEASEPGLRRLFPDRAEEAERAPVPPIRG